MPKKQAFNIDNDFNLLLFLHLCEFTSKLQRILYYKILRSSETSHKIAQKQTKKEEKNRKSQKEQKKTQIEANNKYTPTE